MSENIIKQPFGLNVALPKKTIQEIQKIAKEEIKEISVNPFINYFEENDKVFSGEVSKEIVKYQSQLYSLNKVLHQGQPKRTFRLDV